MNDSMSINQSRFAPMWSIRLGRFLFEYVRLLFALGELSPPLFVVFPLLLSRLLPFTSFSAFCVQILQLLAAAFHFLLEFPPPVASFLLFFQEGSHRRGIWVSEIMLQPSHLPDVDCFYDVVYFPFPERLLGVEVVLVVFFFVFVRPGPPWAGPGEKFSALYEKFKVG